MSAVNEGSCPSAGSVSDLQRLDWMEDNPTKAIAVLKAERDAMMSGHMLRQRIDEAMKPNTKMRGGE
jgi:hypothetical protein